MSARGGRKVHLSRILDSHIENLAETLLILEKSALSSLEKTEWSQVIKMGDEVSKQATITGMLWSGEEPEVKQLEENMETYFNTLNGFVLLCHGSTVGAGPTLHASICTSARQVVDSSVTLFKEAVSIESPNSSKRSSIPHLSGSVWESCANLKKAPTSNCTAIGRAVTCVAVSVKDILREMRELNPTACATLSDASPTEENDEELFGDDLSPEEMLVAKLATKVIYDSLASLKEVIRFVSCIQKNDVSFEAVNSLERLLSLCQEIGSQVNELGALVYPPQETLALKSSAKKILIALSEIQKVVVMMGGFQQSSLAAAFEGLECSLKNMESGLLGIDEISAIERLTL